MLGCRHREFCRWTRLFEVGWPEEWCGPRSGGTRYTGMMTKPGRDRCHEGTM